MADRAPLGVARWRAIPGKGSIQPRVNTDRDTVSSAMSQNVKYLLQNQGASETREGLIWAGSAILAVLDALQNGQPAISFAM